MFILFSMQKHCNTPYYRSNSIAKSSVDYEKKRRVGMSASKHIDKICITAIFMAIVVTIVFIFGDRFGITAAANTMKYESTLFDTSYVHTIDIIMDDWDTFIENCESKKYSACIVVIDGVKYKNIGIRAKGNTSLSNVKTLGSQRYSFKLEFDHYEDGQSCDGLDKLCLNNLIQDNTMMKDYLVYRLMSDFDVNGPLCSYAYITVNGEDWGLYLAVEGIEESFLARNYGSDTGELYKPDSTGFGGSRGNSRDFNMDDFVVQKGMPPMPDGKDPHGMSHSPGDMGGEMGSDDVRLKYIDDDPDSYSNIFDNAKTKVTSADKKRLISVLKSLSEYSGLEDILDMNEVLRYFVVHNFVCNGDSYTGNMIHNYYLHEKDGKLDMIPWDYNLAFGTFQAKEASDAVNESIDNPVSSGGIDDRPMVGWIFSDEAYTGMYHELFAEFLEEWFTDDELASVIDETAEMIRPYVEADPTKFCTTEEFETGVSALSEFVTLRAEVVNRQLEGDDTPVDASGLNLADMGTMNNGMGSGIPQMQGIHAL